MSQKPVHNARLAAISALLPILQESHSAADLATVENQLSSRDEAFTRHLVYGVLRWYDALNWVAGQLLNQPLKKKDQDIHLLVCLGIFQLWKDGTASHAAVHATAECGRNLKKAWAVGLVNALLRRFLRERDSLLAKLEQHDARFAHPAWLLRRIKQDWPDHWREIVIANSEHAPLWLRINRRSSGHSAAIEQLRQGGFSTRQHPAAPDAVAIEPAARVENIPGFPEGRVSVQDPAAQLAVLMLDPQPGERILDACSAPGGKTCHLLETQPGIHLLALDRDASRLELVRDNLRRSGLDCSLKQADAGDPSSWWDGTPFDKILLDAPCSTTGVIRRHPEIKYLRTPAQVACAVDEQRRLLEALWPVLSAGGILVYATCSVLKCENHLQIQEFLSRHHDASLVDHNGNETDTACPGVQIFPGQQEMDGFYYAIIGKSA